MKRAEFARLMNDVAGLLGPGWRAEAVGPHTRTFRILGDSGETLFANPIGTRITISASVPEHSGISGGPSTPTINVAATTAKHVHRYIRDNLLLKWRLAMEELTELLAERDAERAARAQVAARVALALSAPGTGEPDTEVTTEHVHPVKITNVNGHHIQAYAAVAWGGESIQLILRNLTADQAAQLCIIARRLRTGEKE
ncbi:hypothetical protein ACI2L4_09975 [Streptomyces sparsogenes]|uniref:hypothetical protein n=1 Tax=Streptomyces sparsogenes TaxID=67365 RepID=UPI00384B3DF7